MHTATQHGWRNERRTSRTALARAPSAVAIIGEAAVRIPNAANPSGQVRLMPSADAAS